jgi:hypothetical protein
MKKLLASTLFNRAAGQHRLMMRPALIHQIQKRGIISDFFVQPMLQERQQKRVTATDTKEIFQKVN